MQDEYGQTVEHAGPSKPVVILGWEAVPASGDEFREVSDEREARHIASEREAKVRAAELVISRPPTLSDLLRQAERAEIPELNLVVKADVQGSLEALTDALRKLDQEHEEVRLSFVLRGVGAITESDVDLAAVSNATVIGFNVRPDRKALEPADTEKVEMRLYEVIYQVLEDVQSALLGMLKPEFEEIVTGEAEVREIFRVPRVGAIAGCYVRSGVISRGSKVRFLRDGVIIWKGAISSLKRFKEDVREVREGFECGIGLSDFQDLKQGDLIETFDEREVARV
jgi:translation initiation factor IF-2